MKYYNKHVHTVISPYTNNLIINSEIPDLIEGFYPINILENTNLDAKKEQTCVVEVKGISKCEIGQTFLLMCICGVQFAPTKLKMEVNFKLEIIVRNENTEAVLVGTLIM